MSRDPVAKNILTLQLGILLSPVNHTANDRTLGSIVYWIDRFKTRRRFVGFRPRANAFAVWPAVIAAFHYDIDFITQGGPRITDVEQSGRRVKRHPPGIAQANSVVFGSYF